MNVLLAFDKFKDSMTAPVAIAAAAAGFRAALGNKHQLSFVHRPLTDGGEGFAGILTETAGGVLHTTPVRGPLGEKNEATFGMVDSEKLPPKVLHTLNLSPTGRLGILEMAQATGLEKLPTDKRSPWTSSSYGTGQMIAAAIEAGATAILLGVGGSASNDAGLGCLLTLGLEVRNGLPKGSWPAPVNWPDTWEFAGKYNYPDIPIRIACDVSNPILGPRGATAVFGPQKGLKEEDFAKLEKKMSGLVNALLAYENCQPIPKELEGGGAAGGIAWGLASFSGATLVPGFGLVQDWLELEETIRKADIVLTGEGSFDASSQDGKGPYAVIQKASREGKASYVFAGRLEAEDALPHGCRGIEVSPRELDLPTALRRGPELLQQAVEREFG